MSGDKSKKGDDKDDKPKKGKPIILIAIIALVVLGGGGAGAWFFLGKKHDEEGGKGAKKEEHALPAPAQYFAMDPPFVVNLNGPADGPRYLQVEIQVMTRDPEALKKIEENAPAIRARLLMLLSQVQVADIADVAGKQKLQASALAEVQKLMEHETGEKCAEDLLFTSFVTQ